MTSLQGAQPWAAWEAEASVKGGGILTQKGTQGLSQGSKKSAALALGKGERDKRGRPPEG